MNSSSPLALYIRRRAQDLGLSLVELCRQAGISRQSLYLLEQGGAHARLPSLNLVVSLANALRVHPLKLLQLVLDASPITIKAKDSPTVDRSAFAADVTLPDGTLVAPDQRVLKVWKLQNAGRVAWEGRQLLCQDEEVVVYTRSGQELRLAPPLVPDGASIPIPPTPPGETVRLQMGFTAPDAPATVLSYWKMAFADGSLCFPDNRGVWVKLTVVQPAAAAERDQG